MPGAPCFGSGDTVRQECFVGALILLGGVTLAGCGQSLEESASAALPVRGSAGSEDLDAGFNAAFETKLHEIGQISTEEFRKRYAPPEYLKAPTRDPTTARFWDRFTRDPAAA